jgi:hypothetical protein
LYFYLESTVQLHTSQNPKFDVSRTHRQVNPVSPQKDEIEFLPSIYYTGWQLGSKKEKQA